MIVYVNLKHAEWSSDASKHPKTTAFLTAMHARPSFATLIVGEKVFFGR
jgi:hypothetical protein